MSNPRGYPRIQWCGFTATRPWRCGSYGSVASALIEKPTCGDFLPIVDGGFSLQYSPLMEYREGSGLVLFCQMDVTGRTEASPAASQLLSNILDYVSSWKPTPTRKAFYAGAEAGKDHLESVGLALTPYKGVRLGPDEVLIVGPGGGKTLAAHRDEIAVWLKGGGNLLALGLDQDEANSFLPRSLRVTMKKVDYASAYFEPASQDSLLAGIGPADVYSRAPRQLPLIAGGAPDLVGIGNGVLARKGNVVFFQLVPWQFDYKNSYKVKPTFRRSSFTLTRILGNMGIRPATPLLMNMQEPLGERALLGNIPDVVWLEVPGVKEVILPKVWKGYPVGSAEPPKGWELGRFDDSKWRKIKVPGTWEDQFRDLANLDGVFLYRVEFNVPAEIAKPSSPYPVDVTLVLGAVDDEDWTYLNGKFIGSMTKETNPDDYYQVTRKYIVPKGLLKVGRNVLAVKANDLRQAGGIKGAVLERRGAGVKRWLSGLYLDKPKALDDPYRYLRW